MKRVFLVVALAAAGLAWSTNSAAANSCSGHTGLTQISQHCYMAASEVQHLYRSADAEIYQVVQVCKKTSRDGVCSGPKSCTSSGARGTVYAVLSRALSGGAWSKVGDSCLTAAEKQDLGVITPAMVQNAMRRLSWPRPELSVQPPDGQTLVGFDTNFFTRTTATTTQTVSLLGQRVTIEARPSRYLWHFGDGTTRSTTSAGAAYPHLLITHAYDDTAHVRPSVDTVYAGRYRVNDGGWQQIPGTLNVSGAAERLWVRSASPHLTG